MLIANTKSEIGFNISETFWEKQAHSTVYFNYLIINYLLYFLTHVLNAISSKKIKFGGDVKSVSLNDGANGRYHRCLIQRLSLRAGEEIWPLLICFSHD